MLQDEYARLKQQVSTNPIMMEIKALHQKKLLHETKLNKTTNSTPNNTAESNDNLNNSKEFDSNFKKNTKECDDKNIKIFKGLVIILINKRIYL